MIHVTICTIPKLRTTITAIVEGGQFPPCRCPLNPSCTPMATAIKMKNVVCYLNTASILNMQQIFCIYQGSIEPLQL